MRRSVGIGFKITAQLGVSPSSLENLTKLDMQTSIESLQFLCALTKLRELKLYVYQESDSFSQVEKLNPLASLGQLKGLATVASLALKLWIWLLGVDQKSCFDLVLASDSLRDGAPLTQLRSLVRLKTCMTVYLIFASFIFAPLWT